MQSFSIAPAETRTMWLIPILIIVVLVPAVLARGRSLVASRAARFDISPAGLQLRGDWYGRTIPAAQIRGDAVRRVDLSLDADLKPRWRTMGTGLPGYQAGWFRL